jgi:hypothetical protein
MIPISVGGRQRHRCDADPDPNPNFHFDADPDPYPDWYQNDADPQTDPTPNFTHGNREHTFVHSNVNLECFSFPSMANVS